MMRLISLITFTMLLVGCSKQTSETSSLVAASGGGSSASSSPSVTPVAATIDSVSFNNGQYVLAETFNFSITFNKAVTVSGGTPYLELNIGGVTQNANYASGSGSTTLVFSYIVQAPDLDLDGVVFESIQLGSANIRSADTADADLTMGTPNLSGVIVSGTPPVLSSLDINGGSTHTTSTAATMNLSGSNASHMYITTSDNTCASGSSYEVYSTTKALTLNANAVNNYYVKLRDSNNIETDCYAVSITHDNQSPNAMGAISLALDGSDVATDTSSWSSPGDNGPAGIVDYQYAVSTATNDSALVSGAGWTSTSGATSFQIYGGITLLGSTNYYTLVRAVDAAGNVGAYSVSSAWQIIVSPEQVMNLEMSDRSTDSISLGWAYPEDNGTPIQDYQIQIRGGSYSSWTTLSDGVSTNTAHTEGSLDAETSYDFRVRAFNGTNYSMWSNSVTVETLPNIEFFNSGYKAINIGGATDNQVVSFADNNEIKINGSVVTTLQKHDTYNFAGAEFDVIEGTEPIFVAGGIGSGGGSGGANMVWSTQGWVGQDFLIALTRDTPLKIKVYAFTDSNITVKIGNSLEDSAFVSAENGHVFTVSTYASYRIESDGLIVAYAYAVGGAGTKFSDPRPLLPISTDIIGVPSNSAKIFTTTDGTNVTGIFSDSGTTSNTINAGQAAWSVSGNGSQYTSRALRLISDNPIVANSNADSDGYCSASFLPVAMQKTKYGVNVLSEWVTFVADRPVTITRTNPDSSTSTITLTRSGSDPDAPYKARITNVAAGTLFEGDDRYGAWYESDTDTGGIKEDETIMFGWD